MTKKDAWSFSTKAIHVGNQPENETGAVSPPIHFTSTYLQDGIGMDRGFDYSRASNPTRLRLEKNLAALEGADFGFAFSSGMAAITTLFQMLKNDDSVLVSQNVYGGTYRVIEQVLKFHGLRFDFIDMRNLDMVRQSINSKTRIIFIETPTNPMLELADIRAIVDICKPLDILVAVDNTFLSPYGQRPLELGADIIVHSSTKYIGGHSDVISGVIATSNQTVAEKIGMIQKSVGAIPSPFDCWILLRSTKTLSLRVEKQEKNAGKIAQWLQSHSKSERVIYPGLDSHPQKQLAMRQQTTPDGNAFYGSIISIDLGSIQARDNFLKKIQLFTLAESLGGVESLISNPYHMTHGSVPNQDKLDRGITESLVRLSVGIEDVNDLIQDLDQALDN